MGLDEASSVAGGNIQHGGNCGTGGGTHTRGQEIQSSAGLELGW